MKEADKNFGKRYNVLGSMMNTRPHGHHVKLIELIAAGKCPQSLNSESLSELLEISRADAFGVIQSLDKTVFESGDRRTYSLVEQAQEMAKAALCYYHRERMTDVLEIMARLDPATRTEVIAEISHSLTPERYVENERNWHITEDEPETEAEKAKVFEAARERARTKLAQVIATISEFSEKLSK